MCAAVWANTCNIIAPGSPDRTDRGVCITVMEKPCALTEVRSALVRDDGAHTVWGARAREHLQFGCTHLFHLANVVRAFWAGTGPVVAATRRSALANRSGWPDCTMDSAKERERYRQRAQSWCAGPPCVNGD